MQNLLIQEEENNDKTAKKIKGKGCHFYTREKQEVFDYFELMVLMNFNIFAWYFLLSS